MIRNYLWMDCNMCKYRYRAYTGKDSKCPKCGCWGACQVIQDAHLVGPGVKWD